MTGILDDLHKSVIVFVRFSLRVTKKGEKGFDIFRVTTFITSMPTTQCFTGNTVLIDTTALVNLYFWKLYVPPGVRKSYEVICT